MWVLRATKGPRALYYHNITPPEYFPAGSAARSMTQQGYEQLRNSMHLFDIIVGDSCYNISELKKINDFDLPAFHIYPVVEADEIRRASFDANLLSDLRRSAQVNIVFIGRVVRNKGHHNVMRMFEYFYREINRHAHLWFVGNEYSDTSYREELETIRLKSKSKDNIHFVGKITDDKVQSYIRSADVFVCASTHEGFCVPIVEAMAHDVPVVALASTAIPETLGGSGILIQQWNVPEVAELVHLVTSDFRIRDNIITKQRLQLARFSAQEARMRLKCLVDYLRNHTPIPNALVSPLLFV
jgi:glycosyltransferase involved in cell wall biosynthesis